MKTAINGKRQWTVWGALLACLLGGVQVARADLLLTAQSVTVSAGSINDLFNVYITNLGTAPVDVEAFNFEINTTSTDITFEQATTGTTLFPYVFAGNSLFGPVISTSAPGQTLDASDVAATSFTVVNPGASLGLGLISFNVAPGVPNQVAPVNFNTSSAFTGVSDPAGNLLPLQFVSGNITVSSVPEPATGILLLVPLAGMLWSRRFRRQ